MPSTDTAPKTRANAAPARAAGPSTAGVPAPESLSGTTTVHDSVVAKIAGIAARDVPGVTGLGGGAARVVGAIRDALNTTDLTQGVSVEVGETQVAVDVTIVVEYPRALQEVAGAVRAAVYRAMEELVGMEVVEVNIAINDVHIPGDLATGSDGDAQVTTDEAASGTSSTRVR